MAKNRTSFVKGQIANPNGRGKGTPNRTTQEMKDYIKVIIDKNLDRMEEDFSKLSPGTRLMLIEKYAKYYIPTLAQTKNDVDVTGDINITVRYEDDNLNGGNTDSNQE